MALKINKIEWALNLAAWLGYIFIACFGLGAYWERYDEINLAMLWLSFPMAYFTNLLWLMPSFFKPKKWITYFLLLALLFVSIESLRVIFFIIKNGNQDTGFLQQFQTFFLDENELFVPVFFGFLFSFAYSSARSWLTNIKLLEQLKTEKLSAELAFLKSQVNPHFLFNTLNNIYSLALEEGAENTANAIVKLGGLMRYNLHDSQSDFIELSKELNFIKNYIELQQLRITDKNDVKCHFIHDPDQEKKMLIAPMILIPFVENAFKHGIHPNEKSFVNISVDIKTTTLVLKIENSYLPQYEQAPSAVGLKNVEERLQKIYPQRHTLSLNKHEGVFYTQVSLNLL